MRTPPRRRAPRRIVSLIASSTEIVCALGLERELVGRSHECDFPESVKRLPVCTEPKLPVDGASYEIDQRLKALVAEGLSVYRVDAARLRELAPDVILTQTQCEVCAVSRRDVEAAVCEWTGGRPGIVSLEPNALGDVWSDVARVGEALDATPEAIALVASLQERMAAVRDRAAALSRRPSIACIEWIDPLMACGNWMPELVTMAGGRNLLGEAGKHSPWMTFDDLEASDPDVIFVSPCGFDLPRARAEMPALAAHPRWKDLRAVREGRVFLADGNRFFNRPGPRLVESLEMLAEILHPDRFHFGHERDGWERL